MSNTNISSNRTDGIETDGPSNAEILARGDVFTKCDECGRWNVSGSPHQCPTTNRASVMNSNHRDERRAIDNERNDPTDAVVIAPDGACRQRAYHLPALDESECAACDGTAASEQPGTVPWVSYRKRRDEDMVLATPVRQIASCPARLQREGVEWQVMSRQAAQERKCYPCLDCHPGVKREIQSLRETPQPTTTEEPADD